MRGRRPPQARKQRAIREGRFDRTLEGFNMEIGEKMALTLSEYHARYVEPLDARVRMLERLTGIALLRWVRGMPGRLWAKVRGGGE